MRSWDWGKMGRLIAYVVLAFGVGVGAGVASIGDDGSLSLEWPVMIGIAYTAIRVGSKWFKVNYASDTLQKILMWLLAVNLFIALPGCTTTFTKFIDTDGTSYEAKTTAAPFARVDNTAHEFAYQWEGSGGRIGVGQNATGLDNTAQVDGIPAAIQATGKAVGEGIGAAFRAQSPLFSPTAELILPKLLAIQLGSPEAGVK